MNIENPLDGWLNQRARAVKNLSKAGAAKLSLGFPCFQ
jgi:hypothetical protein